MTWQIAPGYSTLNLRDMTGARAASCVNIKNPFTDIESVTTFLFVQPVTAEATSLQDRANIPHEINCGQRARWQCEAGQDGEDEAEFNAREPATMLSPGRSQRLHAPTSGGKTDGCELAQRNLVFESGDFRDLLNTNMK